MTSEKQVCPHYDEDYICDCPFEPCSFFSQYMCPPAEQIKDDLLESALDKQREHENEIDEQNAEIERLKCNQGWNR